MRGRVRLSHTLGGLGAILIAAVLALSGCSGPMVPAGLGLVPTGVPATVLTATALFTATAAATVAATEPAASATEPPPSPTPTAPPTGTPTSAASPTATVAPSATAGPTPDRDALFRLVELPVLMYHYVEPWPADADVVRQGLTVRPEDFEAQIAWLHAHGYAAVSLYDLVAALAVGAPLPEKAVVLTFDDGYRSLMDYALPVMQRYGYTGTVFVVTQLMDEGFEQYLTWDQARSLHAQGWLIEPHTKTHDQLSGRGRDFQLYQMLGSLQTVEANLGRTPRFFAYPSGQYDDLSVQIAKELHLWGAVTVNYARVHNFNSLHTLGRVRVNGTGTLEEFVAALGALP